MANIFDIIPDPERPEEEPEPERIRLTKATVKSVCQEIINSKVYRDSLDVRIKYGTLPPAVETRLWEYAYGKPVDHLEVVDKTERIASMTTQEIEARLREMAEVAHRLRKVEATLENVMAPDDTPSSEPSVH